MDQICLNVSPSPHCSGRDPILFCRFERSPDDYGYDVRPYRSKVWILCCPRCQKYVEAPDLITLLSKWRQLVTKGL